MLDAKFYEIHQASSSPIAAEALRQIGALYEVEDRIRGQSAKVRRVIRNREARPMIDAMKSWLETELGRPPTQCLS